EVIGLEQTRPLQRGVPPLGEGGEQPNRRLVVRRDGGVQITHSHVHQSTEQPVEQRARQASAPLGSVNGDLPYQHGIGLRGSPISDHKPNYFFVNARHDRRVSEIDTPQQVRV